MFFSVEEQPISLKDMIKFYQKFIQIIKIN